MDLELNYKNFIHSHQDKRGTLKKIFNHKIFSRSFDMKKIYQVNLSYNPKKGTIRGLHFQREPNAEVKLVRCLKGSIWDVVVDLRDSSESFGKWFGAKLTDKNRTMMYVPKGFAHGFISLEPNTEILYLVSDFYSPNSEGTLIWNDPDISIKWPIQPKVISEKDQSASILNKIIPIKLTNHEL